MNNNIKVVPHVDELISRYNELAFMNEIPSMARYAADWYILGTKANASNRPALAQMCFSRAEHYKKYDEGEYIKLVEGCLSEMLCVDYMDTTSRAE